MYLRRLKQKNQLCQVCRFARARSLARGNVPMFKVCMCLSALRYQGVFEEIQRALSENTKTHPNGGGKTTIGLSTEQVDGLRSSTIP